MKDYKNQTFPLSLKTCEILDYVKETKGITKKHLVEQAIEHYVYYMSYVTDEQLDKLERKYR